MNVIESVMNVFSGERAKQHQRDRGILAFRDAQLKVLSRVVNTGYSHGGAARRKPWVKGWRYRSKSPKSDIEQNRKTLRERSRDLAMNSPIGAAAVNSTRTNAVGCGLVPKPKIDYELLGISREEARSLEKQIRQEFKIWAESTLCDVADQNNFYELQQIAFSDWLRNGEEFALISYEKEAPYMPYQLRLRLIEGDRISTPGSLSGEYFQDKKLETGNTVMNGVEITKQGKVVAYYVSSVFPDENGGSRQEWTRIPKRGKATGNPNILHIFNSERAEQYRGVPFLAPVIESIKQISRYTEAEIMAAIINSMFSVFITTENGDDLEGFGGEDDELDEPIDENEVTLGAGNVNFLKVGEDVKTVSANHPSGNFDAFLGTMAKLVGAALEIAPEILLKSFNKSFSASKGAMNESWKSIKMRRAWFVNDFCQEIYELWLAEAVSKGRINAPGFFNNLIIRKAYTNCTWVGPTQGQIEPGKEVAAAAQRVKEGFSTREDECAALNGSDFEDIIRTLEYENELMKKANKALEEDETNGES